MSYSMPLVLSGLLGQGLIHPTAEPPGPDAIAAARRMKARARHHMRGAEPVAVVLTALLPFLRVVEIDRREGVPTGGMVVRTTTGGRRWIGQAGHALVVKAGKTSPRIFVSVHQQGRAAA